MGNIRLNSFRDTIAWRTRIGVHVSRAPSTDHLGAPSHPGSFRTQNKWQCRFPAWCPSNRIPPRPSVVHGIQMQLIQMVIWVFKKSQRLAYLRNAAGCGLRKGPTLVALHAMLFQEVQLAKDLQLFTAQAGCNFVYHWRFHILLINSFKAKYLFWVFYRKQRVVVAVPSKTGLPYKTKIIDSL